MGDEGARAPAVPAPPSLPTVLSFRAATVATLQLCSGSWRQNEKPSEGDRQAFRQAADQGGGRDPFPPGTQAP